MAENESKQTRVEIPEAIIEFWNQLQAEEMDEAFSIEVKEPILDMMRELANMSNLAFQHFLRLYVYQQNMEALPNVESGPAMKAFLNSLPNT